MFLQGVQGTEANFTLCLPGQQGSVLPGSACHCQGSGLLRVHSLILLGCPQSGFAQNFTVELDSPLRALGDHNQGDEGRSLYDAHARGFSSHSEPT